MDIIKPLYDDIKLNCTIVSDTHIDIKHPDPKVPQNFLKAALLDSENCEYPADAFITVGDTTSRGEKINWELSLECFKDYKPAEHILLTLGNHDGWSDDEYDGAIERFISYSEKICGFRHELPYFHYVIKGYYFIFLGSDSDSGCEAEISNEQIQWFSDILDEAEKSQKPIFVFCHQSINGKHGLPMTWDKNGSPDDDPMNGGIGEKSDEIEAILKKHNNVFYFSGHSHMGLGGENCKNDWGYSTFECEDSLHLINLPSLACGNHHGDTPHRGIGVQMEVYDDKVVLRPRSYFRHQWIKDIPVKDGKPYYEAKIR